jgi:hypothetical protein
MSSVQRNLQQLTDINKELKRLVSGSGSMVRPRTNLRRQLAKSRFLHREYREPEEVYNTICGVFPCDCDEPHIANIGCQCPSCHFPLRPDSSTKDHHKWTIELVLMPTTAAGSDSSAVSENANVGNIIVSKEFGVPNSLGVSVAHLTHRTTWP